MAQTGYAERLLAIIETQNRIAASDLELPAVMELVVQRARGLTGADVARLEVADAHGAIHAAHAGERPGHEGNGAEAGSLVGVAVRRDGTDVGSLKVYSRAAHAFHAADLQTLEILAGLIAAQIAHASHSDPAGDDTRRDRLTGLGNRRAYEEHLAAECNRAGRHGQPVTLCLFDLEGFARVNNERGRSGGDLVLRQVATVLSRLRAEDAAFRIGDDEFAVLLPGTAAAQATMPVQRLADQLAARVDGDVTARCGLADAPLEPEGLHAAAHARLLEARHAVAARVRRRRTPLAAALNRRDA